MANNANNSIPDTCSHDNDMNGFLRDLFEEKSAKVISIFFSTVGTTFLIILTCRIIWHEKSKEFW